MKTRIERIENLISKEATGLRRNSSAYKLAIEAVENPGTKIRTGWTSGKGRFSSAQNHTSMVAFVLETAKIKFTKGNDAPRGGVDGNYIIVKK